MVKKISHVLREKREFYRKTENGNAENKKKLKKEVMILTNLLLKLISVKLTRLRKRPNKKN
jgi:hypothetical protein